MQLKDKIKDLHDDLLTVLEAHVDDLKMQRLFYHAFRYMTLKMYECVGNHRESLRTLHLGVDDGIQDYMETRQEPPCSQKK